MKQSKAETLAALASLVDDDGDLGKVTDLLGSVLGIVNNERTQSMGLIERVLNRQDAKDRALLDMLARQEQRIDRLTTMVVLQKPTSTPASTVLATANQHSPPPPAPTPMSGDIPAAAKPGFTEQEQSFLNEFTERTIAGTDFGPPPPPPPV